MLYRVQHGDHHAAEHDDDPGGSRAAATERLLRWINPARCQRTCFPPVVLAWVPLEPNSGIQYSKMQDGSACVKRRPPVLVQTLTPAVLPKKKPRQCRGLRVWEKKSPTWWSRRGLRDGRHFGIIHTTKASLEFDSRRGRLNRRSAMRKPTAPHRSSAPRQIETSAEDGEGCRLTDLAVRTGLAPSTVHRLLTTLESGASLVRRPDTTWQIGAKSYLLGSCCSFTGILDFGVLSNPKFAHEARERTSGPAYERRSGL